jgi:hypothetical protein
LHAGRWRCRRLRRAACACRANLAFEELAALDSEAHAGVEVHAQPVFRQDLRDEVVEGVGAKRRGPTEHLQPELRLLGRERAFDPQQVGRDSGVGSDLQVEGLAVVRRIHAAFERERAAEIARLVRTVELEIRPDERAHCTRGLQLAGQVPVIG